ncbi:MAG: HAD hydrolase family protein [Elusimicrobia bacterium]|nr:HAD hydrolase family protein [Elusimicrobiota bacterium]
MDKKRIKVPPAELAKRARAVKLVAMDVDGVLTGGEIVILRSGEEIKFFNSKDRLCLAVMRDTKVPVKTAWITGRSSEAVLEAARDLGVTEVVQKCRNKREALERILERHKLTFDDAAFIGDDLIDLSVLHAVRFSACPSDATGDVLRRVHYVSPFAGGKGVVRDVLEFILKAQGRWDDLVDSFLS